jgi:tetratricopeptide (TPR) repeat protein
MKPNDPKLYLGRGFVYYTTSEFDLAISDYNKAVEMDRRYAQAYYNRALAYYHKGEYDQAWADVYEAQSLGRQLRSDFIGSLRQASGTGK